jgi:hypothetical protein
MGIICDQNRGPAAGVQLKRPDFKEPCLMGIFGVTVPRSDLEALS